MLIFKSLQSPRGHYMTPTQTMHYCRGVFNNKKSLVPETVPCAPRKPRPPKVLPNYQTCRRWHKGHPESWQFFQHSDVSKNWVFPPNHPILNMGFPLFSPSILGYPYFWKHRSLFPEKSHGDESGIFTDPS